MLTDKQLEKYRAIYKKQFDKEISKAEALEQGTKLMNLIKAVYKPMTRQELGELQKRRNDIGG